MPKGQGRDIYNKGNKLIAVIISKLIFFIYLLKHNITHFNVYFN
jgi:hypothetical protein